MKNFEDCIFCLDCKKNITDLRSWKNKKYKASQNPFRYCEDCASKAKGEGYIFRDGQKTTPAIEQMCQESSLSWRNGLENQYF